MPTKPLKPCRHPGCPNLTKNKYCDKHKNLHRNKRESSGRRGYNSRWNKMRKIFLKNNPICVECKKQGRITNATVVDHIIPHRGDYKLFWNQSNWQPLCKRCHDKKTMTKDRYVEYKY